MTYKLFYNLLLRNFPHQPTLKQDIFLQKIADFVMNSTTNDVFVLKGFAGTGKTTIVNMLGKIYKKMGLLSKGHVMEVDRSDLVAQYIGQTAPKVKKAISSGAFSIAFWIR